MLNPSVNLSRKSNDTSAFSTFYVITKKKSHLFNILISEFLSGRVGRKCRHFVSRRKWVWVFVKFISVHVLSYIQVPQCSVAFLETVMWKTQMQPALLYWSGSYMSSSLQPSVELWTTSLWRHLSSWSLSTLLENKWVIELWYSPVTETVHWRYSFIHV